MTALYEAESTIGLQHLSLFLSFLVIAIVARLAITVPFGARADRQPAPAHLALLAGARLQPIYASTAALRASDALTLGADGRLAFGPLPSDAGPMDRAVYDAFRRGVPVDRMDREPAVVAARHELVASAVDAGWLLTPGRRMAARVPGLLLLGLTALGVFLVWNGYYLGLHQIDACLGPLAALLGLILVSVSPLTRRGRAAMEAARSRHRVLIPANAPAWRTYGPAAAATSAALWGAAASGLADPAFAEVAGIPRPGTGSDGGDSGGSCSSSGGDCGGGCGD